MQDTFVVPFPAGIHYGTLSAFYNHFRPGTITINGLDPTDQQNAEALNGIQNGDPVEIVANTGDPQTDRDAVHIAEGLIAQGRDPWQRPGQKMQLPIERYNQAANYARDKWLGLPIETPQPGVVSSDMSVTSKWNVVALGELQQPGGVGATTGYNPVTDGPNPEGPEADNASNSPEQEVAMQTWVNVAVDMLNRGELPEAVIAKLAHDGCPNPEEILQRAQQQPMEEPHPVSDSIGQDPFQAPPPADQTGEMQGLSNQPSTLASMVKEAPGKEHMKGVSDKRNRQYEHIKDSLLESGKSEDKAKEEAARTVNKQRAEHGETKKGSDANEIGGPIGEPADSASTDNTDGTLMKIDNLGDHEKPGLFDVDKEDGADNHTEEITEPKEVKKQETKDVHSKRVRIAGTTMTGRELDRWEGQWGEGQVKIALDDGGTINVDPSVVEPADEETLEYPVSEIQNFIDNMPAVEPSRPFIEARLANLELVRRACRAHISKVSLSDQVKLQEMDTKAEEETALLKEALTNLAEEHEVAYFAKQPRFEVNAWNLGNPQTKEWQGRPREAGAIWASENFDAPTTEENFVAAAAHHASRLGLTGTQFDEFLAGAREAGGGTDLSTYEKRNKVCPECGDLLSNEDRPYCESCGHKIAATDNEGPAEALFV